MQNLSRQEREATADIYKVASDSGITVVGFELPQTLALSVMDAQGRCFIGVDNSRRHSQTEERTMLMHELGHCLTGAFYNEFTPFSLVSKCEKKADEWAIKHFLPYDKIIEAYKSGICSNYELAEYFGVSEQFMGKAVEYYLQRGETNGA